MKILFWINRILIITFAAFLSLFSFDVFGQGEWWEQIVGFLIHNIPSFIIVILLILIWKRPLWGSILFFVLTVIFTVFFRLYQDPISFLIIGLPVFVVSMLFLIEYFLKRKKNSV